jgi:hypothetical protein
MRIFFCNYMHENKSYCGYIFIKSYNKITKNKRFNSPCTLYKRIYTSQHTLNISLDNNLRI